MAVRDAGWNKAQEQLFCSYMSVKALAVLKGMLMRQASYQVISSQRESCVQVHVKQSFVVVCGCQLFLVPE